MVTHQPDVKKRSRIRDELFQGLMKVCIGSRMARPSFEAALQGLPQPAAPKAPAYSYFNMLAFWFECWTMKGKQRVCICGGLRACKHRKVLGNLIISCAMSCILGAGMQNVGYSPRPDSCYGQILIFIA